METEQKKTETAPESVVETKPVVDTPSTIKVDLGGKSYEVPLDLGKEIIAIRQEGKKSKDAIEAAERKAAAESEKAKLLELMKAQDIEAVKAEVSKEYVSKIKQYENKIFGSEIKSLLATEGTLPTALDDAASLVMKDVSVSLKEDKIFIADKPAADYVKEFIKSRPHLVSVKVSEVGKKLTTPGKAPNTEGFEKFVKGVFNK